MTSERGHQVPGQSLAAMGGRTFLFMPFGRQELEQVLTCWLGMTA